MGYYTQYVSTFFKGPWATSIKERFESRRAINNLRASDRNLYRELPRLVEREHKVTKALSEEDKVIRELKEAAANGYSLAFNVSTMDMNILEAVRGLINTWAKLHELGQRMGRGSSLANRIEQLNRVFVELLFKAIKKAEDEERSEYKDVMVIVNESANRNHTQFMQKVRTSFQSLRSQSMLAKLAIRTEIRKERRLLAAIKNINEKCKRLVASIEKTKGKERFDRVLAQFEVFAKESASDIEQVFYEAYLIKKRDFLLILKVIVNAEVLKQLNRRWIITHFMPEAPVKEKEIEIDKIEEKIAKEFHTIAQALRISIRGLQEVEKKLAKAA